MKAIVKSDFDYSADGLTIVRLKAGEIHNISSAMFKGLSDARLVEPFKEVEAPPAIAPVAAPVSDPVTAPVSAPVPHRHGRPHKR